MFCVLGGIRLAFVELRFDKAFRTAKVGLRNDYESYKNVEVLDALIRIDPKYNMRDYFILSVKRVNENQTITHDQSGIVFYSAARDNPYRFVQGGITNLDLLEVCANNYPRVELTKNETLLVPTCSGVRFYRLDQPRIVGSMVSKYDLDNGVNVTLISNDEQPVVFDHDTIHVRQSFYSLLGALIGTIGLSLGAIGWVITRPKKICLEENDDEDDDDEDYDDNPPENSTRFNILDDGDNLNQNTLAA